MSPPSYFTVFDCSGVHGGVLNISKVVCGLGSKNIFLFVREYYIVLSESHLLALLMKKYRALKYVNSHLGQRIERKTLHRIPRCQRYLSKIGKVGLKGNSLEPKNIESYLIIFLVTESTKSLNAGDSLFRTLFLTPTNAPWRRSNLFYL